MTVFILNILVIIILSLAYVPQLKTTYQTKSAEGVSLFFWLLISLSTSYSLFNLLKSGNGMWYDYTGQFINAGIAFILFVWINKLKFGWEKAIVTSIGYVLVNLIVYHVFGLEVTQTLATIAIVAAYVDQLLHFYNHKSAKGTNPNLYFFFATGLTLLLGIMILTNASIHVVITETINITLLIICGIWSKNLLNKEDKL